MPEKDKSEKSESAELSTVDEDSILPSEDGQNSKIFLTLILEHFVDVLRRF